LFDLAAVSSSRPTNIRASPARAGTVKNIRASPARAGTVKAGAGLSAAHPKGLGLDGSEHDGTLAVVGMTMPEEEPACGARRFVPHPCMRWVQRPEP
jgi:hypothetical protein